jgi:hypothetical protein
VGGLRLHANTSTQARDRAARERLCRYASRPAIATERLDRLSDGRLSYTLKRAWRDGTTHVAFVSQALLEKLCGLVPPLRVNLVRDQRALAPGARLRHAIVAQAVADAASGRLRRPGPQRGCATPRPTSAGSGAHPPLPIPIVSDPPTAPRRPRDLRWAELLMRVFAFQLVCARCGGPLRPIAVVTERDAAARVLRHLDLATAPPPLAPARAPPGEDPAFTS